MTVIYLTVMIMYEFASSKETSTTTEKEASSSNHEGVFCEKIGPDNIIGFLFMQTPRGHMTQINQAHRLRVFCPHQRASQALLKFRGA